ncbi:MAG TPA: helix-turn-helix transcriptional regulator [Candidatus Acidoferrales bacterium]|nr:helix-turn-helix transcriptional regulator [Candidatus Acidoferrales bacterium]
MNIGERIRVLREARDLTQGDIEKRTFLKRSYLSRVENGHTIPSVETLEKIARSLNIAMYQFFYEGHSPVDEGSAAKRAASLYGSSGKELFVLDKFRQLLAEMQPRDRRLLLVMAQRMVSDRGTRKRKPLAKRKIPGVEERTSQPVTENIAEAPPAPDHPDFAKP